jgi:amino acid adenylation domain-containing protein
MTYPLTERRTVTRPNRNTQRETRAASFAALHGMFESTADANPDSTAVIFGSAQISYRELDALSNRVARALRARGVDRGAIVALMVPRSIDAYAAMLGILKAGAAYVPVDTGYPPERIAFMLGNSGARALVTTSAVARTLPAFDGVVLRMDADRRVIDAEPPERLTRDEVRVSQDDLCYIIYTSGSTGRPKGVMVEHSSVCHLVCAEADLFFIRREDRVYQGFSLSFDASIEEIWLAFNAGAALVAATPEMSRAGPDLSAMLTARGVSVLSCAPTLLETLAADIPTLRLLILGVESCPAHLVDRWARPGRRIVNTYGPTEATVIATWSELRRGSPVTIGYPVGGYHIHLLDEKLAPVVHGEVGEICIAGMGVARGYLKLPRETEQRFVVLGVGARGRLPVRIYRTGDVGRLNAKGELEFHGRISEHSVAPQESPYR